MKFNPFRPNSAVVPGMFVGRIEEILIIEQCMLQTKNNNPQHFLVHGERGIGKTSLLDYIRFAADFTFPKIGNEDFRFLTVSIDLGRCESDLDIIRKIARAFRQEIEDKENIKVAAKAVWDWVSNWEILGVKYNRPSAKSEVDVEEVLDDFVLQIANFCEQTQGELDGVFFLIDEADRPPVEANLGEFLKFFIERLGRRSCQKVLFGLAGLPPLLGRLRDSHKSSPRLFQIMLLEPLELDERKKVVQLGLESANKKNIEQTIIENDALEFLAELSEGYPHFVQQFAYSAFETDVDNVIDLKDVGDGAFSDNGALSQLGDKFFNEMYNARVSSEDYRRVLDGMSDHGDQWVSRKQIINESGVVETSVTNALKALKDKEIILQDDSRRGYYRLPTRSFAAWINAIRTGSAKMDAEKGM